MKRVFKIVLIIILILLIVIITIASLYIAREFGRNPSKEEYALYENYPNFKNGEFQSPEKLVYGFNDVRNGPTSWSRFLSKSRFAPSGKLPKVMLDKSCFPKTPSDFALY
ncbi:MAG: hypothetical protein LBD73_01800 [Deferribacteraceae bacterium]|nr:hypothetical protein [Deferribacteraceae bacterium]